MAPDTEQPGDRRRALHPLAATDHHLGRLLDFLRGAGELDNTIVLVISDNCASAEGGPTGTTNEAQFFNNAQEPLEESLKLIDEIGGPAHFNHYPWGWTWAGNSRPSAAGSARPIAAEPATRSM